MIAANDCHSSLDSTISFIPRSTGREYLTPVDVKTIAGSRRTPAAARPVVVRNLDGEILHVQISRWRRVAAGPRRRIAEIVELQDGVAVLIEKVGEPTRQTGSRAWQAYDSDGRLTAVLQLSADEQHALLINYQTRQVCQFSRNESGDVLSRGSWPM